MKKLIALILTLSIMACMFTGCERILEILNGETQGDQPNEALLEGELTQQTVDEFYALLEETESFCISTEDLEAAEEKLEKLDDSYMAIVDGYSIAYVNYCLNQADEELKQKYLDAVDITAEVETAYNAMCKRIYLAETSIRDELFADWTAEEIDMMLKRNEEIEQLEKRNEEITVAYRELKEDSDWEENMISLYNELVKNNNRIAEIYGYQNYYEFAYKMVYDRDYDLSEIQKMRDYVAQYLPAAYDGIVAGFTQSYEALKRKDQMLISGLLYDPYDELKKDYVTAYIDAVPDAMRNGMTDMFDSDRVIFTDSPDAFEGAFTTWIGGKPFCYYGPGYDNSVTMIHELGHYYGCSFAESWNQPMDLSETQSQGNEWLFIRFLESQTSSQVYEVMAAYNLMENVGNIICFSMIDELEQKVYASDRAGDMTIQEYEAIMEQIAEPYGGIDYISENIMDVQLYWKYVVLESPVYYISYAVSAVAAINLFTVAETDVNQAYDAYIRLIEEPQDGEGFLGNIQYAGLTGPFEETVYQELSKRYAN